jgi:type VI secretion system protein ImpM
MTGFLGKLPTVGDFVARNLPDPIVEAWMDLTDAAFALGARRDGADWYESCQEARPLCFALAPGALVAGELAPSTLGEDGWFGLLRPSLDSFGRSYPFTVMSPLPRAVPVLGVPTRMHRWFAKTDIATLSAMEGSLTVDHLSRVLEGIVTAPEPGHEDAPLVPLQFTNESVQGWFSPLGAEDGTGNLAWYEMLVTEILGKTGAPTLWWPLSTGDMPGPAALLRGMPGPEGFREFLKGDWARFQGGTLTAEAVDAGPDNEASE